MWAQHLDKQLYKVLDFQYRRALQQLRSSLPDQLRKTYYRSLKAVLDYPCTFRGLAASKGESAATAAATASSAAGGAAAAGGATDASADDFATPFHLIPARNAAALKQVYAGAEQLFAELDAVRAAFAPWGALGGGTDVDEYIRTRVHDEADYECNLSALRVRRRDAERLPDQRRVECFVVSLVPFKAAIDDHIQRTHDALLLALRRAVVDEATQLGEFVKSALEVCTCGMRIASAPC